MTACLYDAIYYLAGSSKNYLIKQKNVQAFDLAIYALLKVQTLWSDTSAVVFFSVVNISKKLQIYGITGY